MAYKYTEEDFERDMKKRREALFKKYAGPRPRPAPPQPPERRPKPPKPKRKKR